MTRTLPVKLVQAAAHAGSLLPLVLLAIDYFSGQLEPNPAQSLEQRSGRIAVTLLTLTLMVSPLARFLRQPAIKQARRPLGLYTFLFVTLHLMVLVGYDYRFDLPLLFESYSGKPFIWLGLSSGLILAGLALTSFAWWKRRLYKWWQRIHRLLYLAAILDLAHYFLGIKGNILTLSGNIARPSAYAIVMIVLLLLRLPMWIHTTGIRHNGSSTDLE